MPRRDSEQETLKIEDEKMRTLRRARLHRALDAMMDRAMARDASKTCEHCGTTGPDVKENRFGDFLCSRCAEREAKAEYEE